jgi:hypothetical protein
VRLAVVAAGLGLGIRYLAYEQEHGQGVSAWTVLVFCLLSAGTAIVLWEWKVPVHFAARAASAAVAVATVLLLGTVALAMLVAVFATYLLALFTATALSVVAFVPMRTIHAAWLLWRRIYRRCPYDDCGRGGLPIHICTCGERYADLLPSFYGLFHHTCRHADGEVKLPTLDFLGRNRLPRLCRHCQRPLVLSSLGELPEQPVAVVGGPSAGKTVFLRQATRALRDRLAVLPGSQVQVDAAAHERDLASDLQLLDRGQVPAKTGGDVMQALGLAMRLPRPHRLRSLLYLFDAPGEHFASLERFGRKQVVQHLGGIILLVDPFALPPLVEQGRRQAAGLKPSEAPLDHVVGVLLAGVNQLLVHQPAEKCSVPLAVVLAKADALPVAEHSYLAGLSPADGLPPTAGHSGQCREALVRLGGGNSVRALEQKFRTIRYFACSGLGRLPDPKDTRPFRPAGVAEPLLWLLGLDAGDVPGSRT